MIWLLLRSLVSTFETRRSLALENLALRQQLAVLQRSVKRPRLSNLGSSRQGRNPAGESPAVPIARFRHVAIPRPMLGNQMGIAWRKRPGRPARRIRSGGCNRGVEQVWEPEHKGMTAAPRRAPSLKLHCGDYFGVPSLSHLRRGRCPSGRNGRSTEGAQRGTGPSSYTRIAEITSGRAIYQQGLATTCKDPSSRRKLETEGGIWSGAWARMSDEGGVMFSEATLDVAPAGGNAPGRAKEPWGLGGLATRRYPDTVPGRAVSPSRTSS